MNHRSLIDKLPQHLLLATLLLFAAGVSLAQVPVDDQGNPVGEAVAAGDETVDAAPQRSTAELEDMVGRIALYPDDLLAIVLPASTYPLEIVQAARFLDEVEKDSSLQPDESWDESVTALLNYPEVLRMMNDDIDWTWQLGELFKIENGEIRRVEAIFHQAPFGIASGWSTYENSISEEIQNVR